MKKQKYGLLTLQHGLFIAVVFALLTRFVGLMWGFPYPMHPDERNMVDAILRMNSTNSFNPNFFAYGELPLFLGYAIKSILLLIPQLGINEFNVIQLSLRFVSAFASFFSCFVVMRIVKRITNSDGAGLLAFVFMTTLPVTILFAHYGTTESLLIYFLLVIIERSFLALDPNKTILRELSIASVFVGLAIATKVSSVIFFCIPIFVLIYSLRKKPLRVISYIFTMIALTVSTTTLLSPHVLLNIQDFKSTIEYETNVATGASKVFYTVQFEQTIPVLFQFINIYPYALGIVFTILFTVAFFILPYKKEYSFLRIFVILFGSSIWFLYAKWTRFSAPLFPLMVIMVSVLVYHIYKTNLSTSFINTFKYYTLSFFIMYQCVYGLLYFSIFIKNDVRFNASDYIVNTVSPSISMLTESANIVDLPISNKPFTSIPYNSINIHELDDNGSLFEQTMHVLKNTSIVQIPSRRVLLNYTCFDTDGTYDENRFTIWNGHYPTKCGYLKNRYPNIHEYYQTLFNTFVLKKDFSGSPNILGLQINDENAEETFTVFDHPVVRIYEKK